MILKALYDYYKKSDCLVPKGLEDKEIGYLIVINKDGTFLRIESRMIDNKTATSFRVLQMAKRSGKKYIPNCFWDKYEYIIGGNGESEKKNETFRELVNKYNTLLPNNDCVNAIFNFYQKYENIEDVISADVLYEEVRKSTKNISFLLQGDTNIAAENEDILKEALSKPNMEFSVGVCLITGEKSPISRLHTSIKLNKDTGPLVSFQKKAGYDSYGKTQANNAPIGEDGEFAYTTALNYLLRKDSHNKFLLGNRTFVFWAAKDNEAGKSAEECIWSLFGNLEQKEEDLNKGVEQVRKVFKSIYSGYLQTSLDDKFYILGLAPNSARIAVIYWAETPLQEFAGMILKHFDDMEICDLRKDKKPYAGLRSMLSAVTLNGNEKDVTPNIPEAVVKSIFQGLPYPQPLYSSCIRRIRAEQNITITRAAIIKAYLNRLINDEQKISIMLDKTNTNQGYLCGRLFAVLDKIQEDANNQHTIKERYMNAASSTPASVFATIMNLSSHHSEKLRKESKKIYFEKIKQEIMDKISANGFPSHLDLQDQGRFFVGYYHQKQDLYNQNENNNNNNN